MMSNIVDRVQANADNIASLIKNVVPAISELRSEIKKIYEQIDTQENDIRYLRSQQKASVQYHKLNGKRVLDTIEKLKESIERRFDNTLDSL
jgi:predicted  nucleic acid-binding Zn-ribbon protein